MTFVEATMTGSGAIARGFRLLRALEVVDGKLRAIHFPNIISCCTCYTNKDCGVSIICSKRGLQMISSDTKNNDAALLLKREGKRSGHSRLARTNTSRRSEINVAMSSKQQVALSSSSSGNRVLSRAKNAKQDEFYTQLNDISNELKHYKAHLRGKRILCNCDDPYESNFFKYFALNFNSLGIKKLMATSYVRSPIVGGQLPLLDIEGLKPDGKEPYAIEINKVPDHKRSRPSARPNSRPLAPSHLGINP